MGAIAEAKRADPVYGPTIDLYRGDVPRPAILHWVAKEVGTWGPKGRFAVSIDKRLEELSWEQVPIARARKMGADPFHTIGAIWMACREAVEDIAYWRAAGSDDGQRSEIGKWLTRTDRNVLWIAETDYSIGSGALRHVLLGTIARLRNLGRRPDDGGPGLMDSAIDWAEHTDLSLPAHRSYWGRQSPEKILARLRKHRDWIDDAAQVGPIDDVPPGGEPPATPPDGVPPFPAALVPAAKIAALRGSTDDECLHAWEGTRAYARARMRAETGVRPSLAKRAVEFMAGLREPEPRVVVERDWGFRAVAPW